MGSNTVKTFKDGIDKIEIQAETGTATFADITVTDQGKNTLVEYEGTDILLIKFNHNLIDATDFIF